MTEPERQPDAPNLELVSTDDLRRELLRRVDHGGLVLMRCGTGPGGVHEYWRSWGGNSHTVIGLLADLADRVRARFRQGESDVVEDGPDGPCDPPLGEEEDD